MVPALAGSFALSLSLTCAGATANPPDATTAATKTARTRKRTNFATGEPSGSGASAGDPGAVRGKAIIARQHHGGNDRENEPMDGHFRRVELAIPIDQFHRLPRNAAYKYEYFDGR